MDERDKTLWKAIKTRKVSDWSNYKQLKSRWKNIIKHAKQKYHSSQIANKSKKPKAFWKAVKEIFLTKYITSSSFTPSFIPEKISKTNNFCIFFFISCWIPENISITINSNLPGRRGFKMTPSPHLCRFLKNISSIERLEILFLWLLIVS